MMSSTLPPVLELLAAGRAQPHGAGEERAAHPDVAAEQQVVEHGHLREQLDVLERAGDAELGDLVRAACPLMLVPFQRMSPLWGMYTWLIELKIDVLPAPLGPMMANSSPRVDAERDVVDRHHAAEAQLDPSTRATAAVA